MPKTPPSSLLLTAAMLFPACFADPTPSLSATGEDDEEPVVDLPAAEETDTQNETGTADTTDTDSEEGTTDTDSEEETTDEGMSDLPLDMGMPMETECGFFEGWESGGPDENGWSSDGPEPWGVSPWVDGVHSGELGVRSPELSPGDAAWVTRTFYVHLPATLTFFYWASIGDGGSFQILTGGEISLEGSPSDEYQFGEVMLEPGDNEITFLYIRDLMGGSGLYNRVWLDTIDLACDL